MYALNQSITETNQALKKAIDKTKAIQKSLLNHPNSQSELYKEANSIQTQLQDLDMILNGNRLKVEKMELIAPSIAARLNRVKWNFYNTMELPTTADQENHKIALMEFTSFEKEFRTINDKQLMTLEQQLKALGIYYKN